jgi:hypothetical protein
MGSPANDVVTPAVENAPVVDIAPVVETAPVTEHRDRVLEVLSTSMRIHELCIERPSIIAYLQTISPEKQTIALVHALEVGVTEVVARRGRFHH